MLDLEQVFEDYKYCLLGNSEWIQVYKSDTDFITFISIERDKKDGLPMDIFNQIGDNYMNNFYDFIHKNELLYALKFGLTREDTEEIYLA